MKFSLNAEFSAAHFYSQSQWTVEKNKMQFGLCYSPYGHGHNYQLILEFKNESLQNLDSEQKSLKSALEQVIKELDHKHLNHEIAFFKDHIPTTENIAVYLLDRFRNIAIKQPTLLILKEMDSLWVEIQL